ncbi:MAG: hypothetical protein HC913_06685 [Microscillaceae bacterium]|nr:hypothetical protein [Microscillaceae bacterium]
MIWGALHGLALALHKLWMDISGTKGTEAKGFRRFLGQLLTFHFVCFCWIYFRATDLGQVNKMLYQIGFSFQASVIGAVLLGYKEVFLLMLLGFVVHWIPRRHKDHLADYFVQIPDLAKAFVIAVVVLLLFQARSAAIQPFIYFQF